MKISMPESTKNAVTCIDELLMQNYKTYTDFESGIDTVAEKMKQEITNSPSEYDASLPCFYISNAGDDNNDGRTPATAWQTLKNVNDPEKTFAGCNILFKRGGIWRGEIQIPHSHMTFSAYGTGQKPRLYGSYRNYAKPEYWKKSEYENVWYTDLCSNNVGMIAINHSDVLGKYDEIMCYRNLLGKDGFEGPHQLCKEFNFHSNPDEAITYLYCDKGNPGEVYDSIEFGEDYNLIHATPNAQEDITFDNLLIKYVGRCAVSGLDGRKNVTVRNCIFCYLGGSIWRVYDKNKRTVGLGNAVESFGGCDGFYVYGNWIYQIYDTAITHQCSQIPPTSLMDDIRYVGNLCEFCHWSIEFYNMETPDNVRYVHNVRIHHNILRLGGYGWGSRGRENAAALFNSFGLCRDTENHIAYNNIFDRCAGGIVRYANENDKKIRTFDNVYIQRRDGALGWIYDGVKPFDGAEKTITELLGEETPCVFYEGE